MPAGPPGSTGWPSPRTSDGTTVIRGPVVDQAALHGLLHKVRDIGLPLVSVTRIDPDRPIHPSRSLT